MKIIKRPEFLALPANTVFAKYEPCILGDLMIKGDSCGGHPPVDFFYRDVVAVESSGSDELMDLMLRAPETGESFPLDPDGTSRDGCFDDDQLFAVMDADDIEGIIGMLQECLAPVCKVLSVPDAWLAYGDEVAACMQREHGMQAGRAESLVRLRAPAACEVLERLLKVNNVKTFRPECGCGGVIVPHHVGDKGCFRTMVAAPLPAAVKSDLGPLWNLPGVAGSVTDFTLRQQWGYHQHPCGLWSRFATDDDSPC